MAFSRRSFLKTAGVGAAATTMVGAGERTGAAPVVLGPGPVTLRLKVNGAFQPVTVHDLGKLLLAFTMLWGYVNFSQFLIVWSGNISEETPFYLHRLHGGWQGVAVMLLVFHFALPFALLLSRPLKRSARALGVVAALMLLMRLNWIG